jgi:hypothetical protein
VELIRPAEQVQLTAVFVIRCTLALKATVPPVVTDVIAGEIVTEPRPGTGG